MWWLPEPPLCSRPYAVRVPCSVCEQPRAPWSWLFWICTLLAYASFVYGNVAYKAMIAYSAWQLAYLSGYLEVQDYVFH